MTHIHRRVECSFISGDEYLHEVQDSAQTSTAAKWEGRSYKDWTFSHAIVSSGDFSDVDGIVHVVHCL